MMKGPPEELRAFLEEISPKKLSEETSKKRSMFQLFLTRSKTSKLFEVEDDLVAAKIMAIFEPHVWKIDSSSEILQGTLIHYFITRGFKTSLVHLLCHNYPHMKEMVFGRDRAQRSPLRIALVSFKFNEDELQTKILERLWKLMNSAGQAKLEEHFRKYDKDILHICAEKAADKSRKDEGLKGRYLIKIAKVLLIGADSKQEVLRKGADDRTVLDMCADEKVLIDLLQLLDPLDQIEDILRDIKYKDKGKNLLHVWAGRNFEKAIDFFRRSVSPAVFTDMIFEESKNGSTPLMVCALNGNKKTLQYLLCALTVDMLTWTEDQKKDRMEIILHKQNNYGNTLLSLVLQHNEALEVSKHILLEWEKVAHKVEDDDEKTTAGQKQRKNLTKCMRTHLKQSFEVQEALDDVDHSLEKKKTKKVLTWLQVGLKTLLLPLIFLVLDAWPDFVLVDWYRRDYEGENVTMTLRQDFQFKGRESCQNSTLADIPAALDKQSKFLYSLAFVVSPWCFYLFEYFHSPHCEHFQKVSKNACI